MRRRHITTKLIGSIKGTIWMPAVECTKEINLNLTRERRLLTPSRSGSLRYLLEQACNDGDFRSAKLTRDSYLEVTVESHRPGRIVSTTRTFYLAEFKNTADLLEEYQ